MFYYFILDLANLVVLKHVKCTVPSLWNTFNDYYNIIIIIIIRIDNLNTQIHPIFTSARTHSPILINHTK